MVVWHAFTQLMIVCCLKSKLHNKCLGERLGSSITCQQCKVMDCQERYQHPSPQVKTSHLNATLKYFNVWSQSKSLNVAVGKPYFENVQYNSPIDIYDDDTVDEMVKIMNTAAAANQASSTAPAVNQTAPAVPAFMNKTDYDDETVSNLGWSVRTSTKTLIKPNPNNFQTAGKSVAWSSDM